MRRPRLGDAATVDGRPARIVAVNVDATTVCVMFTDEVDAYGQGDRAHDLPWPVLDGQRWACEVPPE